MSPKKVKTSGELSFEAAFARLEEIVRQLEAGGLPLEQALTLYEEGMKLVQISNERLDAAELRISTLSAAAEASATERPGE